MPRIGPFEEHTARYEHWFSDHPHIYESEVEALRTLLPTSGTGVEIGVGSGRFAAPLGIEYGLEPSNAMRQIAEKRGVTTILGVGEMVPYANESFEYVLMVTTLCFLDDVKTAFQEIMRILKPGGAFLNGFIARESPVGRFYTAHKEENVFYRIATFYSVREVTTLLIHTGFSNIQYCQTIFHLPEEITEPEQIRPGYGEGSFVVVRADKPT